MFSLSVKDRGLIGKSSEHFFQLCTGQPPTPVLQPLRNRSLFRLGHFISVTLRLMATSRVHYHSRHEWSPSTTYALDEASNVAFLILTAVLVLLALNYVRVNLVGEGHLRSISSASINKNSWKLVLNSIMMTVLPPHLQPLRLRLRHLQFHRRQRVALTIGIPLSSSFLSRSSSCCDNPSPQQLALYQRSRTISATNTYGTFSSQRQKSWQSFFSRILDWCLTGGSHESTMSKGQTLIQILLRVQEIVMRGSHDLLWSFCACTIAAHRSVTGLQEMVNWDFFFFINGATSDRELCGWCV